MTKHRVLWATLVIAPSLIVPVVLILWFAHSYDDAKRCAKAIGEERDQGLNRAEDQQTRTRGGFSPRVALIFFCLIPARSFDTRQV
jgi:hypothetical protein